MLVSGRVLKSWCRQQQRVFVRHYARVESVRLSKFEDQRLDYQRLTENLERVRKTYDKSSHLTLAEKILYAHLPTQRHSKREDQEDGLPGTTMTQQQGGDSYLHVDVDRVACNDAAAQMALLQLMAAGLGRTKVPTTVHCDHLIEAQHNANRDLGRAEGLHKEVYEFLAAASAKHGIGFWKPGSGIMHQLVLEHYAFPGGLLLGTDGHTPHAGGLGMLGFAAGGADAVHVMAGDPYELKQPRVIGVRLEGQLSGWASPKDIILTVAGHLKGKGAEGAILEYHGPAADTLSCSGMATVCNMGGEIGAASSLFPFSQRMHDYLCATNCHDVAYAAQSVADTFLRPDEDAKYDDVIEIHLDRLEPHINGPFTPDLTTPVADFKNKLSHEDWPQALSAALIGSCSNGSYQDMNRAAHIARQAAERGLKVKVPFLVSPGSEQVRATLERDGHLDLFDQVGGSLLANACGPCAGQWDRSATSKDKKQDTYDAPWNSIISSYNRNFRGINDGNPNTHAFIASPEIVMAMAFAGKLTFNPMRDRIVGVDGIPFKFQPPSMDQASDDDLPQKGDYCNGDDHRYYQPPTDDGAAALLDVHVHPQSQRLQLLEPFAAWDQKDIEQVPILIKVQGQCTAEHISMAGPWLKYRGHLDNIANNLLIGARNAENGEINRVRNLVTGKYASVPETARDYKARGIRWVVVADEHYGEGSSSQEHAAMEPRYLNGVAVIAKSFARIHETNLKRQGMLPLTFANPEDYNKVDPSDLVSIVGLSDNSMQLTLVLHKERGDTVEVPLSHTFSKDQLEWFKAGSALNALRETRV